MIKLNEEWQQLFINYENDHQDPRNRACHKVGIPLILASLPIGATIVGLPLASTLFTVGWSIQFLGHHFEGNDPNFFGDRRGLIVGALWWFEKMGAPLVDRRAGA